MAETSGLVQQLTIFPLTSASFACAWVGPHPTNTEIFYIVRDNADSASLGAFKNSMVDALTSAYVSRQEVTIQHADDAAEVGSLSFEPS